MNELEAGEIILKNEPFIECINCDGRGWCFTLQATAVCTSCRGKQKQLLQEYEMACRVLGLDITLAWWRLSDQSRSS